ncbi:hypothetical protein N9W77_01080, partial [bacterium]|nr:hypothetical protein [bacterium]
LALALMYSTVPLAHMIMMDFESDPYAVEEETSFDSELLTHSGFDGHLMSTLTGTAGTWGDTITYYEGNNMSDNTSMWTNSHERYPAGDGNPIHATMGDGVFTFANGAWVWYVDATTGETIDSFACHQWVTTDGENNSGFLPEIGQPCTLAFTTDDAMYIVDEGNFIHRFNTFDESPGLMMKQATWRLPVGLDAHIETIYAESLADDKVMIVSPTMAVVIELEEFSEANDPNAPEATNFAKVVFQHNATSTITSADFGPSPWSSAVYNRPDSGEEIMLLGEENGDVIGFEWNASATPEFTKEEGMMLEGFGTSIQSVRLVDKDATGYTELLITTNTQSHWLYGGNLIQKLSIDIEEGFSTGWFSTDADDHVSPGASVEVNAKVINTGGNTDAPFKVSFFAGDSEKPFDEVTLTGIDSKEVIEVSTVWSAENVDRLRVVVDRDNLIIEVNDDDNSAEHSVEMAYPKYLGWFDSPRENPLAWIFIVTSIIVLIGVATIAARTSIDHSDGMFEDDEDWDEDEDGDYEDEEEDDYDED